MPHQQRQRPSAGRKHQQAVLAKWQVEIVRSGTDQLALEQIRQRALHDREVRDDPELAAQIERFIHDRSIEIHRTLGRKPADANQSHPAHFSHFAGYDPTREEIAKIIDHLRQQAEDQLRRSDESAAGFTLERMKTLQREHPELVDNAILRPLLDAHDALRRQRRNIHHEIEALARKAVDAASSGDAETAAAAMRQLSAYHIAHPDTLTDDTMDDIRQRVLVAGARVQHEQAAKDLMRREREVSEELRTLRDTLADYRRSALADPHDSMAYRTAESAYRKAVREIRHHDREWLAATILELVGLLDDWEDHPRSADKQVDKFIQTLKSTLRQLHREIRQAERLRRGE